MITSELEPSKNLEKNFDDCFALISSYFNTNILDSIQEDKQLIKKINKMKDAIAVISNYINSIPIHFILDLPPSHEAAVEQICHHLLFDNNSPLNVKYSDKFKVSLYMMTPIDQQSALEKNKAYLKNLMYNKRRYSSKIDDFIRNKHLKNCFVFIDNHNIINTNNINQPTDTDMSNVMGKYLPKDYYSCAFIPFMELNKEASRIFHRNTLASSIDLSSVEHNSMANLVEKTK